MKPTALHLSYGIFHLTVIVAALGYFVDIYDLLLFTIVKKDSIYRRALDILDASTIQVSNEAVRPIAWRIAGVCWRIKREGFVLSVPYSCIPWLIS
jgi:hypothetical protein